MKPKHLLMSVLAVFAQACAPDGVAPSGTCSAQEITAQQWNKEITAGWNLGNSLECGARGVDNESVVIDKA